MQEITERVSSINISLLREEEPNPTTLLLRQPRQVMCIHSYEQRYMQQYKDVELSALGMAFSTVVSVAEILKNNGFAVEKKILTSTVEIRDESRGRPISNAKIEIVLGKTEKFDELMAAAAEERAKDNEAQS